jgi:hypothetical protein
MVDRKLYAGIGSRQTPPEVIEKMREFAYHASRRGWILRSGAADGADSAFETGCDDAKGKKEIFLPWAKCHGHTSPYFTPSDGALKLAKEIHPAWDFLRVHQKKLIARNMHQIMGPHLGEAVKCVVCWTPDGCESYETYGRRTGGTGTAIALASLNNVPIFNLQKEDRFIDAIEFLLLN